MGREVKALEQTRPVFIGNSLLILRLSKTICCTCHYFLSLDEFTSHYPCFINAQIVTHYAVQRSPLKSFVYFGALRLLCPVATSFFGIERMIDLITTPVLLR